MKKNYLLVLLAVSVNHYSQVLNHQNAIFGGAERHLQFKVSDAPNDVMEILSSTSQSNQFQPAIWVHKESSNGPVLVLAAHVTPQVDFGITPIINLTAGIGIFDNNAPYSSQFPWGEGGTTGLVQNRPIFAVSNAYNSFLTIAANGNIGMGTKNPLAKLHNVGTARFENLPTLNSGCILRINYVTGELGIDPTTCSKVQGLPILDKRPILNALNTVNNIETYEFKDEKSNLNSAFNTEKTKITQGDYQTLIPYLLESIKELNAKITDLESRLNAKNGANPSDEINVKVYPNPVRDIFTIYFEKAINSKYSVKIFDNNGRIAQQKSLNIKENKTNINVSNFSTGVYLYEITNADGKQITKGKFIKE